MKIQKVNENKYRRVIDWERLITNTGVIASVLVMCMIIIVVGGAL